MRRRALFFALLMAAYQFSRSSCRSEANCEHLFLRPAPISATLASCAHEQVKRALRQMARWPKKLFPRHNKRAKPLLAPELPPAATANSHKILLYGRKKFYVSR